MITLTIIFGKGVEMSSEYVSVEDIVKRYMFHAEAKAGEEISQIINEVKKHNEAMIPKSVLEDIKAEIEKQYNWLQSTGRALYDVDIAFDAIRKAIDNHI